MRLRTALGSALLVTAGVAAAQSGAPPLEQKMPGPATPTPAGRATPATDPQAGSTQLDAAPTPVPTSTATPRAAPPAGDVPGDPVNASAPPPKR